MLRRVERGMTRISKKKLVNASQVSAVVLLRHSQTRAKEGHELTTYNRLLLLLYGTRDGLNGATRKVTESQ